MGWARGLVWFPSKHRWIQKKTKIGALQNGCPKLISRPQTQSSYKACVLKNGLFGNMSYLYVSNFPQETPQSFFPVPEASAAPIFTRLPSFLPKKIREETLVPGHGQDFNTLLCTAWNEPKIALWNDWSRRHFVKNVGSYKMIRPTKNVLFTKWHGWPEKYPYKMPPFVGKMPPEWNMRQAIS